MSRLVYSKVLPTKTSLHSSVPFFFEPNFDALVKPIPGALRKKAEETGELENPVYKPVVYGDFLLAKVGSNFAGESSGRY